MPPPSRRLELGNLAALEEEPSRHRPARPAAEPLGYNAESVARRAEVASTSSAPAPSTTVSPTVEFSGTPGISFVKIVLIVLLLLAVGVAGAFVGGAFS
jgi:hypothetical protein